MSRLVQPSDHTSRDDTPWLERVAKYIPSEVVVAFKGFFAILTPVPDAQPLKIYLAWIGFCIFLVGTPVYLWKANKLSKIPVGWEAAKPQLLIGTVSFAVWAYALGGPFSLSGQPSVWGGYQEWAGGAILVLYVFGVGAFQPRKGDAPASR